MITYHLIIKTSSHPEWGSRLSSFWSSLKALGIKTDEKVLYLNNDSQVESVYKLAIDNGIDVRLAREPSNIVA